jgi:hypothetical protein
MNVLQCSLDPLFLDLGAMPMPMSDNQSDIILGLKPEPYGTADVFQLSLSCERQQSCILNLNSQ